ncbi:hypothetical protein [Pedobacter chitinilyticus]|uniref:Uncharacterized protein n=1 Tax=Pedobacter chitinilyticus TaxID=2233776 RepID=A0A3S3PQG2_9SPHI|nr:hypothetical protein [Pedobacter chitinilyticus]RWU10636.1 hypothetical protein DPV69_04670 [Pedobacter chitinilyticus]
MAITNLNNTHLSTAEATAAKQAVSQLETALAVITVTLSSKERKKYGRINEQNKLFVNKVHDYHQNQPELSSDKFDWDEFDRDYESRQLMENLIIRLRNLLTKLKSAKILHDFDNYQASLNDYNYTSFMAGSGAENYEVKMKELKQFFSKAKIKKDKDPEA